MEETAGRRTGKEEGEGHEELRGKEETAEEKQTEETWSDGEAGRSRKIINGEEKDAEGEEERTRRGGKSTECRVRVAISTSNSIGRNLMFLLQLHLHVYKQEWQLLYWTHTNKTEGHTFILALRCHHHTTFISTDSTGRSKDNGGVQSCVRVCARVSQTWQLSRWWRRKSQGQRRSAPRYRRLVI